MDDELTRQVVCGRHYPLHGLAGLPPPRLPAKNEGMVQILGRILHLLLGDPDRLDRPPAEREALNLFEEGALPHPFPQAQHAEPRSLALTRYLEGNHLVLLSLLLAPE